MIFPRLQGKNRTLTQLVGVIATMGALSFAAEPFIRALASATITNSSHRIADSSHCEIKAATGNALTFSNFKRETIVPYSIPTVSVGTP